MVSEITLYVDPDKKVNYWILTPNCAFLDADIYGKDSLNGVYVFIPMLLEHKEQSWSWIKIVWA